MAIIEGARPRPLTKSTAPVAGDFNGEANKGQMCTDTSTGIVYVNTGTLAATVWTVVGTQVAP
jgi:hypothetical protein